MYRDQFRKFADSPSKQQETDDLAENFGTGDVQTSAVLGSHLQSNTIDNAFDSNPSTAPMAAGANNGAHNSSDPKLNSDLAHVKDTSEPVVESRKSTSKGRSIGKGDRRQVKIFQDSPE